MMCLKSWISQDTDKCKYLGESVRHAVPGWRYVFATETDNYYKEFSLIYSILITKFIP